MKSSESAAFSSSNYELERDLIPGEAIFISNTGEMHTQIGSESTTLTPGG
jgi:Glutamine phosphoribosylpyrophosphate amidotransferase